MSDRHMAGHIRICIWAFVLLLLAAILACGTAVTLTPYYVCPTAVPTPFVLEPTPLPGTPLPLPTVIPFPPTPYVITPPQDFYVGDAVLVGQTNAPLRLRLRLLGVQTHPMSSNTENLYTWRLEIANLGSEVYETVPVALMVITRIETAYGTEFGTWRTSEAAMRDAGFTSESYDVLLPGSSRIYRLAAYGAAGTVRQLAYTLDGDSGNRITWANSANPYCSGDSTD